ncbi:hypothetical protein [Microvirga sesbaniae]|uniref:hypothetical protein n=1 Tax=Microvirga sesbaniae TaxID=681392 RepID=UPI0021C81CBD|nr:hypothetical protein [Microvirga sp. HBU67692]
MALAGWTMALVISVTTLLEVEAARAEMFGDKFAALNAVKSASPRESSCSTDGRYRVGYGQELGYCVYKGTDVEVRLAAADDALLMDIRYDIITFNHNFPNPKIDSLVKDYMGRASELFQKFSFTFDDLRKCSFEQQFAYKEHLEWHPKPVPEPKPTRISHPPLVLYCRWTPAGFYLAVRPIVGELPDDPFENVK